MLLTGLAEVVAVDRKCHSQGEQPGTAKQRPRQQLPVLNSLFAQDAQPIDGTEERQNVLDVEGSINAWHFVLPQERLDTSIVRLWRIDVSQDAPVSLAKCVKAHRRNDVG